MAAVLREVQEKEIDALLAQIKEHVEECIYIYTDIYTYRTDNPSMCVWVEKREQEYSLILMKYHDSAQIYASEGFRSWDDLVDLLRQLDVTVINGQKWVIQKLEEILSDKYYSDYGYILRLLNHIPTGLEDQCYIAGLDEVPEIAALLAHDDYYSSYCDEEELTRQLSERIRTNMGRSAVLRKDGKIVAHCASFTEAAGIAVDAATICHKDYRGRKFGITVENYMNIKMNQLGYKCFTFLTDINRVKAFEKAGNKVVAEYGKLIKRQS